MKDVALLCYHSGNRSQNVDDMAKLLKLDPNHAYSAYITPILNTFQDKEGRLWISEELLDRPLSAITPLRDFALFCRYARDLSYGLDCIHDQGYVHGDLKLDNCGIDGNGRAKIFDIGSMTSSPNGGPFNVFSRPPEAFDALYSSKQQPLTKSGDIWSLGATLLALALGRYPFVTNEEVARREELAQSLRDKSLTPDLVTERKLALDQVIEARAKKGDCAEKLNELLHENFDGSVAACLCRMMDFDPDMRPTSDVLGRMWANIANTFASADLAIERSTSSWDAIESTLGHILKQQIIITPKHLSRLINDWDQLNELTKAEFPGVQNNLTKIKEMMNH
jgi:serine/threonine protein kinase